MATRVNRPKLALWKLASCDGCQLTLLDCEDELLTLAGQVEIAHFAEASSTEVAGRLGMTEEETDRVFATFNVASRAFAN